MAKFKPLPPLAELQEFFDYDPDTGILVRLKSTGRYGAGSEAGSVGGAGYKAFCFKGSKYYVHRAAWYMVTGTDPLEKDIDHKDNDRTNNRFNNLRIATRKQNCGNRKGVKGYTFSKKEQMYVAQICIDYKHYRLGRFKTKEEASAAYEEAAKANFGEFKDKFY
jgi:hypothetical protein